MFLLVSQSIHSFTVTVIHFTDYLHISLLLAPDRDHVSALARLNSHLSPCPSSACLSDSVSRVDTHPTVDTTDPHRRQDSATRGDKQEQAAKHIHPRHPSVTSIKPYTSPVTSPVPVRANTDHAISQSPIDRSEILTLESHVPRTRRDLYRTHEVIRRIVIVWRCPPYTVTPDAEPSDRRDRGAYAAVWVGCAPSGQARSASIHTSHSRRGSGRSARSEAAPEPRLARIGRGWGVGVGRRPLLAPTLRPGRRDLDGLLPPDLLWHIEGGGDDRDGDLVVEGLVDRCAKDDVRILPRGGQAARGGSAEASGEAWQAEARRRHSRLSRSRR